MKTWYEEYVTDDEVNEIMNLDHDEFDEYMFELIEYYRDRPVEAVYDILGLGLTEYQKVVFEEAWKAKNIFLLQSRGAGKSFMMVIFVALWSILYPNEAILMLAPSFRQSLMLYDKMMREVFEKSFSFQYELLPDKQGRQRGTMSASYKFKNNTKISFLPLGDGNKIRGERASMIILDEYAQFDKSLVDRVILPMAISDLNYDPDNPTTDGFQPKFFYSTSAYFKFNHAYSIFQTHLQRMAFDKDYYAGIVTWELPLAAGLYNKKFIEKQRREMAKDDFEMEMNCKWIASNENAFISMQLWDKGIKYEEQLQPLFKGVEGKEYVLLADIARSEGGDNASLKLCEIRLNKLAVVRQMAINGQPYQYIRDRIREFCRDFNIVDIWMDRFGGGQAMEDLLAEEWFDFDTGKTYMPILRKEDSSGKGVPLLTFIAANTELNHEMGHLVKKHIEKGNYIFPTLMDRHEDKEMEMAYLDLIAVKKEVTNIQAFPTGNYHTFKPTKGSGLRKDRWTTFCYSALYIDRELDRKADDELYLEIF